jgi:NAD(P)-dependent dehydrogenase (short-subunit alcohol dehydrogenase family)
MENSKFAGKVCVVTGGASGLGREIARQLAASGAIVVVADIAKSGLEAAAADGLETIETDVTAPESVLSLVDATVAKHGRIDYFFNNAGIAVAGEIRDLSLEHWRRVIEVNLFGEINCIHHVYPQMIAQGFGHIVNTASGFGMAPGPLNSPYVASKFAIFGISHALAAEAKDFGISVSIVCPGYIDTGMVGAMNIVNADAAAMRAQIPTKLVPVENAARLILDGVARRKRVIAFPSYVGLLAFLHRFAPPLFDRFAARQIRDFRTIRGAKA